MSVKCMTWAFDIRVGDPLAKILLLKLADRSDDNGRGAYFSRNKLAEFCECSKATITRKIAYLKEQGLINVETRLRENGSQTSNEYLLNLAWEENEKPTPPDQFDQGGVRTGDQGGYSHGDQGGYSHGDHPRDVPLDVPLDKKEKQKLISPIPDDQVRVLPKSDPAILPGRCQKHIDSKYCSCDECKIAVQRLIVNAKKLWPDRFVIPHRATLIKHWSDWNTSITVDDILKKIKQDVEAGKRYPTSNRKTEREPLSTAIDTAILEIEYRSGQ